MTASDGDDFDERPPRRRARRDVIEIGREDRPARRRERDDRDDDDDEDRDDRRSGGRAGRDRNEDSRDRNDDSRSRDRDRNANGGRDNDDRDKGNGGKDKQDENGKDDSRKDDGDKGKSKDKQDDGDKQGEEAQARRKSRRPLVITIAVVVGVLLIGYGVYYWITHRNKVGTDDAYTDGNVVAIAPRIAGQVISLDVNDNQFVHKGDPLIHIDPRPFLYDRDEAKGALDSAKAQIQSQTFGVEIAKKNFPASLQLAQANLASAKASLSLAEANNNRQKGLPRQATTQQDVDTTASSYAQAQAQVQQAEARVVQAEPVQQNIGQSETQVSQLTGQAEQAQARLGTAELNVEFTVVRAPQDGWVTRRNVDTGYYVTAGQQIMSLVTTDLWVTANFKETELDGMRPGQRVKIAVDAHPDLDLSGHVDSIQHGSGSKFSAFPAENATGNFVKIVQRVPVKILIDSGLDANEPLPLGVSVEPTVTLK